MAEAKKMPAFMVQIRSAICDRCDERCSAFLAGQIDHADPAAECPRQWPSRWHRYGRADASIQRADATPAAAPIGTQAAPRNSRQVSVPIAAKAHHLGRALMRWAKGGFGFVDWRTRRLRRQACEACEAWRPKGNLGFGECTDLRCGCTKLKRWLPGETCPRGKWPS